MRKTGNKLLRLKDVLDRVPVGRTSWWNGVKKGIFPQPIKLGPRTTCWREEDIDAFIEGLTSAEEKSQDQKGVLQ
ncbi:helix-turn-helix transcriptional regulator [Desulfohalobium retbaense]|uniref:Phage transcriptional regulator, AlpA n=1 Tax=Desulfohalobium retbaense (strain ATCC 49708 / DSM 5692 / JCM 16813 / HR100) TaxID=485915 RepID=C8X398_DESRD|nr:AlpA family phage regulatory protein [Desulfohalobium retbaense]ACV68895.1 phage transcriptional regulator, AlpA [Desulfohalobium retbaense DSM 5692]